MLCVAFIQYTVIQLPKFILAAPMLFIESAFVKKGGDPIPLRTEPKSNICLPPCVVRWHCVVVTPKPTPTDADPQPNGSKRRGVHVSHTHTPYNNPTI